MPKRILIAGAGGFGRAVADVVLAHGNYEVVGFADDRWPDVATVGLLPVLGSISRLEELRSHAVSLVIAIGNNTSRARIFALAEAAGFDLPPLIHPSAYIAAGVTVGRGVLVMAGAVIGAQAQLADGCLINSGAILDHDCKIASFAHVGLAASMGGGASLTTGAYLPQMTALGSGASFP